MLRRELLFPEVKSGDLELSGIDPSTGEHKHFADVVGDCFHYGFRQDRKPTIIHLVSGTWRVELGRVIIMKVEGARSLSVRQRPATYHIGPEVWYRMTLLSGEGVVIQITNGTTATLDRFEITNPPPWQRPGQRF